MVSGWRLAANGLLARAAPPFRRQRCGNHPSPKTLRRLLSRRCGEGAGRPGLARCFDSFTVSTKPDLGRPSDPPVKSRSGRDGAAPRSRFPRALRLAALASGLTGSPPMTLLPATREGHGTASGPLHWRAASRRGPSIDLRKDPRGILPPGFIARPQPADIGALDPTPSPPTGWEESDTGPGADGL